MNPKSLTAKWPKHELGKPVLGLTHYDASRTHHSTLTHAQVEVAFQ